MTFIASLCRRSLSIKPLFRISKFGFVTSGSVFASTDCKIMPSIIMHEIPCRTEKIDSPTFKSIFTPELQFVQDLFKKYNFELRIAGGAVRDILLCNVPEDIDFATTATPQQMMELFDKESIRMLHKRGEKHGTITCRINDKANFEITTLRIDKLCDGRHAEVEFTTDWQKDANRRDLTVNSLFLDLDGILYDYFDGVADLKNRRIRFVGETEQRIREDYLRILRYFRFFGRLANSPDSHDQKTLETIRQNVDGLKGISGERLWLEFKKIVTGRFSGPVMRTLLECNVGQFLGLPENPNIGEFEKITSLCENHNPRPMTLISALLSTEDQVLALDKRLKMSNHERFQGIFIIRNRATLQNVDLNDGKIAEQHFKNLIIDLGNPNSKLNGALDFVIELIKYAGRFELLDSITNWKAPKFPVDGIMLMHMGVKKGPIIKVALMKLFEVWRESNYEETAENLLKSLKTLDLKIDRSTPSPDKVSVKS